MAALLGALFIGDHGRLLGRYRSQRMNLDRAFTDERALTEHLEQLLAAKIHRITVRRVDLVNDTTDVDVRFEVDDSRVAVAAPSRRFGMWVKS